MSDSESISITRFFFYQFRVIKAIFNHLRLSEKSKPARYIFKRMCFNCKKIPSFCNPSAILYHHSSFTIHTYLFHSLPFSTFNHALSSFAIFCHPLPSVAMFCHPLPSFAILFHPLAFATLWLLPPFDFCNPLTIATLYHVCHPLSPFVTL